MTASLSDYTGLITSEHRDKPKFSALVTAMGSAFADMRNGFSTISGSFDIDNAVGKQLDIIGLWVGLSRKVSIPLSVYFSFDTAGLGFNQGSWKGPYDPTQGLTTLDDETYRRMLKAKIGANSWDGSMPALQKILSKVFAGSGTQAFACDNQDMTMDFYLVGASPPAVLASLLKNGYLRLKPAGVHINGYTKASVDGAPLFGFDVQNSYVSGFDSGAWGVSL